MKKLYLWASYLFFPFGDIFLNLVQKGVEFLFIPAGYLTVIDGSSINVAIETYLGGEDKNRQHCLDLEFHNVVRCFIF